MKKYRFLIAVIIIFVISEKLGYLVRDMYFASSYGGSDESSVHNLNIIIVFFLSSLINVASAIWIYIEVRCCPTISKLWILMGLVLGILGIILFYTSMCFEKLKKE